MGSFQIVQRDGTSHDVFVDDDDLDEVLAAGRWYVVARLGGRRYVMGRLHGSHWTESMTYLHRWLLGLRQGDPLVDHRNGDGLDCRRENLRPTDEVGNGANMAAVNTRGASRYRGVCGRPGAWRAYQMIAGTNHHLGTHPTEEAAAAAVAAFRIERDRCEVPT